MKNILNIIRHDLKKISGSVVAIITVMGLCIVPCLYAWFNIFSNWAPYESDATGRISVAVANEDEGFTAAGLKINVGEKIVSALEANDAIGWVFTDTADEAKEGVRSSDFYAAIVIPESFTSDALSFMNGDLSNPKIIYYENEKKNAIAPKITGKAKTALQEEVNAAFVETLASYVSDAASIAEASGTDPVRLLDDLSSKADALGRDIDSCIALSSSATGLTSAAGTLMDASERLIDSTQNVLSENDRVLDGIEGRVAVRNAAIEKARQEAWQAIEDMTASIDELNAKINELLMADLAADPAAYDFFVNHDRDIWVAAFDAMQQQAAEQADTLQRAGYPTLADDFTQLASSMGDVSTDLSALSTNMTDAERAAALTRLSEDLTAVGNIRADIRAQIRTDIEENIARALSDTRSSVASYRQTLTAANSGLGGLSRLMASYGESLDTLKGSVNKTTDNLRSLKSGAGALSGMLSNAAGSELLQTLSGLLANDESAVAEYLANPIKMDSQVIWPIETYGSAMAPFYTVLAQWVGALLTAVLIKVKIKKRKDLKDLKLREWYFGRYCLYLMVGISQALIVSLGDLMYVRVQCRHPLLFVLAACVNGIVFTMINYALVFALDNIGLGAGVIILVLQVAGSGGTYPVEVLPAPFRVLYPFMPFRYSMDAMRECIAGMYGGTYLSCMAVLMAFLIFSIAFGLSLYHPARRLNELIAASKEKSEIML